MEQHYNVSLGDLRVFSPFGKQEASVVLRLALTNEEQSAIQTELASMGATDITVTPRQFRFPNVIALSLILILWGMNPVIAKWFLLQGMPPLNLIVLRLLTFGAFSTLFFLVWKFFGRPYSPVPHLARRTILPFLGLFGMTLCNYLALATMPPSLHLTILRFNTLLITVLAFSQKRTSHVRLSLILLGLLLIPLFILLNTPNAPPWEGLAYSFLALISYTVYSISVEHVMQQSGISRRYPLLLFSIGGMLGIVGLLLLPFLKQTVLVALSAWAVLYVVICVCIPHTLHHFLLRNLKFQQFTDLYLLEVPLAILFETSLLGIAMHPVQYIIITVILLTLLLARWRALAAHATWIPAH